MNFLCIVLFSYIFQFKLVEEKKNCANSIEKGTGFFFFNRNHFFVAIFVCGSIYKHKCGVKNKYLFKELCIWRDEEEKQWQKIVFPYIENISNL
jgi:hypothetical protein